MQHRIFIGPDGVSQAVYSDRLASWLRCKGFATTTPRRAGRVDTLDDMPEYVQQSVRGPGSQTDGFFVAVPGGSETGSAIDGPFVTYKEAVEAEQQIVEDMLRTGEVAAIGVSHAG